MKFPALLKALLACAAMLTLTGFLWFGPGADEQRRNDYIAAHPELSASVRALIQGGQVAQGMTQDQVRAAWGSPPADCHGWQSNLQTIWNYCHHPGSTLVIFDQNGRVSNVQVPQ
jgi:hypothetical protein